MLDRMTGIQFEEYLIMFFEACGYQATKTPSSHDQGADIILKLLGESIAVQAKRQKNPVGNKAVQEVFAAKKYYLAHKAMVITTCTFTKSAIDLANRLGVDLWDRKKLLDEIRKHEFS
jgi:restriction system protein